MNVRRKTVAKLRNLFGSVVLALFAPTIASACAGHSELVSFTGEQPVWQQRPCDDIGRAFLEGLNGKRIMSLALAARFPEDFAFYLSARFFLNSLARSEEAPEDFSNFADAYAQLKVAVYLLQQEASQPQLRKDAYRVFLDLAYVLHGGVSSTGQEAILTYLRPEAGAAGFKSLREPLCFVQSDIPTLSPEPIIASAVFKRCMQN